MNSLSISERNNAGITAMEYGDFNTAKLYFRSAVQDMQSYFRTLQVEASTSADPTLLSSDSDTVDVPKIHPLPLSALPIMEASLPHPDNAAAAMVVDDDGGCCCEEEDDDDVPMMDSHRHNNSSNNSISSMMKSYRSHANGGASDATGQEGGYSNTNESNQQPPMALYAHGIRMMDILSDPSTGTASTLFSNDLIEEERIRSAIVVYNLALVFHLDAIRGILMVQQGINNNNNSNCCLVYNAKLQRAKRLYQQAQRLVAPVVQESILANQQYYHSVAATGNILLDLLVCGIWNNLAQIHMECYEYDESKQLFKFLARIAAAQQQQRPQHPEEQATTTTRWLVSEQFDTEMESFLLNAALVEFLNLTSAPAA